jgi:hypothetical protein
LAVGCWLLAVGCLAVGCLAVWLFAVRCSLFALRVPFDDLLFFGGLLFAFLPLFAVLRQWRSFGCLLFALRVPFDDLLLFGGLLFALCSSRSLSLNKKYKNLC